MSDHLYIRICPVVPCMHFTFGRDRLALIFANQHVLLSSRDLACTYIHIDWVLYVDSHSDATLQTLRILLHTRLVSSHASETGPTASYHRLLTQHRALRGQPCGTEEVG